MQHFNSIINRLMTCQTQEEVKAIMDEEALRVENLDEAGWVNEVKATSEALKYVTEKVQELIRQKESGCEIPISKNDFKNIDFVP
jgi:hypothetical protein